MVQPARPKMRAKNGRLHEEADLMTRHTLRQHQAQALERRAEDRSLLLFWEMRLGKTVVAIRWAAQWIHRLGGRVLVVAPVESQRGWERELAREGLESVRLAGATIQKQATLESQPGAAFVIINPEGVVAWPEILRESWSVLVVDESTRMRNPRARFSRLMLRAARSVECRAVLSGEPAPESQLDLVNQVVFAREEFMGCKTYWQFRHRYFRRAGWEWKCSDRTTSQIRRELRDVAEVMTQAQAGLLFTKSVEQLGCTMSKEMRREYVTAEREWRVGDLETKWSLVVLMWQRRMAGGHSPSGRSSPHKQDLLRRLLQEDLRDKPVVVWCWYRQEIDAVAEIARAIGRDVRTISGEVATADRDEAVSALEIGAVVVAQPRAARFGVDMSAADAAVYYSQDWSRETRAQTMARLLHMRRTAPALYVDLVCEDTVDEDMVAAAESKRLASRYFLERVLAKIKRSRR